ncbi:unnamed protein product, partial [Mesorhabditis spiculigera]
MPHDSRRRAGPIFLKVFICLFSIGTCYFCLNGLLLRSVENSRSSSDSTYISSRFDEDDLGCNGFSMQERVETQRRILESINHDISMASQKLGSTVAQLETIMKQIFEKRDELEATDLQKEVALRELRDLEEKRMVRVRLPYSPLEIRNTSIPAATIKQSRHLDDMLDFSRCPIANFLSVYVYPLPTNAGSLAREYYETLRRTPWSIADPAQACILLNIADDNSPQQDVLPFSAKTPNNMVVNVGEKSRFDPTTTIIYVEPRALKENTMSLWPIYLNVAERFDWRTYPTLQPYERKYLFNVMSYDNYSPDELNELRVSAQNSLDQASINDCPQDEACKQKAEILGLSTFTIITADANIYENFYRALAQNSVPVVMSMNIRLPFEDCIDWGLAAIRLPPARLPELHFILRSFAPTHIIELRLNGRRFFEKYIGNVEGIMHTLFGCLSTQLFLPSRPQTVVQSASLFEGSFMAPIRLPVNRPIDEEYLGPLEAPVDSPSFQNNFTALQLYAHKIWSAAHSAQFSPEYLPFEDEIPSLLSHQLGSSLVMRPMLPGSGKEFKEALGGNREKESFTAVILTYNRSSVLDATLRKLHGMKNLNKVLVIWNSPVNETVFSWPALHVPIEPQMENSLNSRFVPWDRIKTEAVLSLDDDIDIRKDEIDLAFRVWRENRESIVGFPARYHAEFGGELYYNSNKTCQYSMILTGYAFIHKNYFNAYTHSMVSDVRNHVDSVMNCEDIAMNFLVSHITRKPPIKVTSKWTLRCPNCAEKLSDDDGHFNKRHECIRLFTKIYGYNPLKNTQYRADSVLFKTRVENGAQKCYNFV